MPFSVCCRRWDHQFYLSSLLLGNSCRDDWRVTTLVPFDSIFYISFVFLVSLWQEDWRICALSPLGPSVFSFAIVNPLYFVSGWLLCYDASADWVCFTLYAFLVSSWQAARCVDAAMPSLLLFSLLSSWKFVQRGLLWRRHYYFGIFLLFRCFRLVILWRADRCLDAAVTVIFSFSCPVDLLALLRPTRPSYW